jgi:hypothetical protein
LLFRYRQVSLYSYSYMYTVCFLGVTTLLVVFYSPLAGFSPLAY